MSSAQQVVTHRYTLIYYQLSINIYFSGIFLELFILDGHLISVQFMNFTNYDFGGNKELEFDMPLFEEVMRNRKSLGRLYIKTCRCKKYFVSYSGRFMQWRRECWIEEGACCQKRNVFHTGNNFRRLTVSSSKLLFKRTNPWCGAQSTNQHHPHGSKIFFNYWILTRHLLQN